MTDDAGPKATRLTIVGIGEDGWRGLGETARDALRKAELVVGSDRQLDLLPDEVAGTRERWPSPMAPRVDALAAAVGHEDPSIGGTVVLGSGDPMLHGIGSTLARVVDARRLHVLPAPSAFSLACARLGWAQAETPLISRVAEPGTPAGETLRRAGRAIVYVAGPSGARELAAELADDGLGDARLVVMERLGGEAERLVDSTVQAWHEDADPLHLVALEWTLPAELAAGRLASSVPGLPDELYGGDGQLTRAEVRVVVLAALAPREGERLWDVGAGSGTVAIEWCRAARGATALAIERRADRVATIEANAAALDASQVEVVTGEAPSILDDLARPDAVFVGGGPSIPGLLDRCWQALADGGRLVATAVTLEGEAALAAARAAYGGRLVRLEHAHLESLGNFTGWKPERPVVVWSLVKDEPTAHPEVR